MKGWGAIGLVVGLAALAFGLTRGLTAWAAKPSDQPVFELGRGGTPDDTSLVEGVGALQRAAARPGVSARTLGDLALLQLERARRAGPTHADFRVRIDRAVAAQRAALSRAPANGSGWARLVYAEKLRAQAPGAPPPGAAAARALEMSFRTRDLSFSLVRFRLEAALGDWATIRPWLRDAARSEVHELTRYGVRGIDALVECSLRFPRLDIIGEELAADADQKALFEKRLARRLKAG